MKEIHTKKEEEEVQSVIQAKSKKIRVLAVECMKAFEEAGLKNMLTVKAAHQKMGHPDSCYMFSALKVMHIKGLGTNPR